MSFFDIHINNSVVKIDNHFEDTFKQRNDEKTENQDCEDVDSEPVHDTSSNQHTEPVKETATPQQPLSNVPPKTVKDFSHSPLKPFFADQRIAEIIWAWLHELMDKQDYPRPKLMPLRAVYEAGYFTQRIPYKIYIAEFGSISTASYYRWMKGEGAYNSSELDTLIEQLSTKLPRFSK